MIKNQNPSNINISDLCQLICKTKASHLENCRRIYLYIRDTLLPAARTFTRHFHHFNNWIFPLENPIIKPTCSPTRIVTFRPCKTEPDAYLFTKTNLIKYKSLHSAQQRRELWAYVETCILIRLTLNIKHAFSCRKVCIDIVFHTFIINFFFLKDKKKYYLSKDKWLWKVLCISSNFLNAVVYVNERHSTYKYCVI